MQCGRVAVGAHINVHTGAEEIVHNSAPVVERSKDECLAEDLFRFIGGRFARRSADVGPIRTVGARIIEE